MARIKAKPGDKIIVTDLNLPNRFKQEFVVIESLLCPRALNDISECIWVKSKEAPYVAFWLRHSNYEIVKQPKVESSVSCQDCGGTGKVVLFTSTVKCERCNV